MISVELWRARIGAFNNKGYSGFLSSLFSSYAPFKFHRRRKRCACAAQEPPGPATSEETESLLTVASDSRNTPFPATKKRVIVNTIKKFLLFITFFWSSFSSRFLPTSSSSLCSLLRSTRLNRCLLREAIVRLVLLIIVIISQSLIISGDIETNPGPVTGQDATPTILDLFGMKGADGNSLDIIEKIAAGDYERFGIHLLHDRNGTRVKLLKEKNIDPEKVTLKILQKWLDSDAAPRTYHHLMKCLKKSGLSALAVSIGNSIGQDHSSLTGYVDKLKRVYQTPPTTWLSLPNCKHIKLAMTIEKGTRRTRKPYMLLVHRAERAIEPLMASKVPLDMDKIFDEGTFENFHTPLVILVEGALGSGKSTLAYHYCQKWADGNLDMFDLVVLVHLRHPAVHSAEFDFTLHQLLLLASDGEEGIDDIIVTNVVQSIKGGLKFLLILDGWDEGPACLQAPPDPMHPTDNSYLGKLLRSVSFNTTILITSRPDSSVDLHNRPNVKRVEIRGFTIDSIHEYFREALSTQLSSTILQDECRKLKDHLANYPAIESSCYLPLNAVILIIIYLQRDRTLPTTHFEMFHELLLCFIAREVNTRPPKRTLGTISSLDDLPRDLKKQLNHISILAYEGVMNNKIVFTQDELPSILPRSSWDTILNFLSHYFPTVFTPAQQDLPAMGVLQRVQWAGTSSKTISYNFVHLSIQQMLAAYRISQMGRDEQVSVFQILISEPRFTAVLHFYAGFTKLTNQGVRTIITGSDLFSYEESSKRSLLNYVRCFYEAQILDQSLYSNFFPRLNGILDLSYVSLSPLDCMSVGYFLALVSRNSRKLRVNLNRCGINDHSFDLMMGELSKHAETSPAGALHGVTELGIGDNNIGDKGIALISTALSTVTKLNISVCNMSDDGAESLARALTVNKTLLELDVSYNRDMSDAGIAHIATALRTNNTLKKVEIGRETATDEGALSLAAALTANSSMEYLMLHWSTTHPYSTLKNIGKCVSKSTLRTLHLEMSMPASDEAPVTAERSIEWLQCVEVGGKKLIQALVNSHLEDLSLFLYTPSYFKELLLDQSRQALETTAATVNTRRREKGLPQINTIFH